MRRRLRSGFSLKERLRFRLFEDGASEERGMRRIRFLALWEVASESGKQRVCGARGVWQVSRVCIIDLCRFVMVWEGGGLAKEGYEGRVKIAFGEGERGLFGGGGWPFEEGGVRGVGYRRRAGKEKSKERDGLLSHGKRRVMKGIITKVLDLLKFDWIQIETVSSTKEALWVPFPAYCNASQPCYSSSSIIMEFPLIRTQLSAIDPLKYPPDQLTPFTLKTRLRLRSSILPRTTSLQTFPNRLCWILLPPAYIVHATPLSYSHRTNPHLRLYCIAFTVSITSFLHSEHLILNITCLTSILGWLP